MQKSLLVVIIIFIIANLTACKGEERKACKEKDLEYTVCDEGSLPQSLLDIIREKREHPFQLTYKTKDYLYIVQGYGAQDRNDIQVSVKELYLTKNSIVIDTMLCAKEGETLEHQLVTYPWIVIRCVASDMPVEFR